MYIQNPTHLGLREEMPSYLQHKIKLSNNILLLGVPFCTVYTLVYYYIFPPVAIYTLIALASSILCLWLNHIGQHKLSRMILSISSIWLVSIIHGYALDEGERAIGSFMVFLASLTLIPWVVFDWRENLWLFIALFLNYSFVLSVDYFNQWYESDLDKSVFYDPRFSFAVASSGLLLFAILMYILIKRGYASELANQNLIDEITQQKQKVEEQSQVLQQNMTMVERAKADEERRNWVYEGIKGVNTIIREEEQLSVIYRKVLNHLVKYAGAHQGGLYALVSDEKEHWLFLEAAYAYQKESEVTRSFKLGEGLVGQCAQDRKKIVLGEIPEHYPRIPSGLGDSAPRMILIFPVMTQDQVEGVLEIAALAPLETHQITFLEEATGILAAALQKLKINERTHVLLSTTRQQAEELQAREEEMRQNFEEMQAAEEAMHRKEQEYLKKIEVLEQKLQAHSNSSYS